MCGRFTLTQQKLDEVVESLAIHAEPGLLQTHQARFNVAPGQSHWVVTTGQARRHLIEARWGLINSWSKDSKVAYRQFNARAETIAQRPAWREAYKKRRCLVLTDGFYEWSGPKKARVPWWFHRQDRGLLLLAGLHEDWVQPDTGELVTTFSVVTTEANDVVRPVHHRMPVIVSEANIDRWLLGPAPRSLLEPASSSLLAVHAVGTRVGSARHDDPSLIEPVDAAEPIGASGSKQLELYPR